MTISLLPLVAVLAAVPHDSQETASDVGVIRGSVLARGGAPVPGAEVLLLDDATGYPISSVSGGSAFARAKAGDADPLHSWSFATTDAEGRFAFQDVRPGTYRLVAQSWRDGDLGEDRNDARKKPGVLLPAFSVDLRGAVGGVEVAAGATAEVELKPLGNGVFVYDRGAGNDDWYLMLSTAPPTEDPVLGFVGWRGPFCRNAIGAIRMQDGQAIVRGLPITHVHFAIFANDSSPCWGAGSFRANLKRINSRDTNLVGGWSDAHKTPPERLEPVVAAVRAAREAEGPSAVLARILDGREKAWWDSDNGRGNMMQEMFAVADVLAPLDRKVALTKGGKVYRVGDILAAMGYIHLGRKR